jgi:hypothetical protein
LGQNAEEEMINHPLHLAVADTINEQLSDQYKLLRDPACGGNQLLPLFVGPKKGRATRMCCVDLLILDSDKIRGIIEVEESGFLPTKLCGKFLQAALASHFIHDSHAEGPIPYAEQVSFIQIIDSSKFLKPGSRKDAQAELIEQEIQSLLPLQGITEYRLLLVSGKDDRIGLTEVGKIVHQMSSDHQSKATNE